MCANLTNEDIPYRKLDHDYQTVVITFDIKHVMLITDIVRRREIHFNL